MNDFGFDNQVIENRDAQGRVTGIGGGPNQQTVYDGQPKYQIRSGGGKDLYQLGKESVERRRAREAAGYKGQAVKTFK